MRTPIALSPTGRAAVKLGASRRNSQAFRTLLGALAADPAVVEAGIAEREAILEVLDLDPTATIDEIIAAITHLFEASGVDADPTGEPAPPEPAMMRRLAYALRCGCRVGTPAPGCASAAVGECRDCQGEARAEAQRAVRSGLYFGESVRIV